jgi:hypothetical protein
VHTALGCHTLPQGGVLRKKQILLLGGDKTWKKILVYVSFFIKFFGGLGVFREGVAYFGIVDL